MQDNKEILDTFAYDASQSGNKSVDPYDIFKRKYNYDLSDADIQYLRNKYLYYIKLNEKKTPHFNDINSLGKNHDPYDELESIKKRILYMHSY